MNLRTFSRIFYFRPLRGRYFLVFSCLLAFSRMSYRWSLRGPPFCVDRKRGKSNQRAPKPPFGIWLFYTGVRRGDVLTSYGFAVMHFTRFRPVRRRAGGVRFTRLRRKARHHLFSAISLPKALLPPDSIVLLQLRRKRQHFKNTQPDL